MQCSLIKLAMDNGAEIAVKKDGTYVADKDAYGDTKRLLSGIVESSLGKEDLLHAEVFLRDLLKKATTATPVQPKAAS